MCAMIRKQVYIDRRQESILKRLARRLGVTEAELIRRAIDAQLGSATTTALPLDPVAWDEARAFMLARAALGAVPGPRTWKRDEIYEERTGRYGR